MGKIILGFRQFILRGNAVDLTVGIVIGAAFGALVSSLVADILTPILASLTKTADFSKLVWLLNGSEIKYGNFLNVLISFVIVSFAVYFFVVVPVTKFTRKKDEISAPTSEEIILLRDIRDTLKNR
ncbi:MAG: hypothetical protein A2741_00350 [Candidatus Zambryskibacteria bacterium RIFCSPHIGHO2_01_FULL_43_27]|nr:MAG: hypothetical protein A2741_00350 [Candidatus Zambryskibacteria bacterium RIFCSPHIGHO2_01_FULL_43_27]